MLIVYSILLLLAVISIIVLCYNDWACRKVKEELERVRTNILMKREWSNEIVLQLDDIDEAVKEIRNIKFTSFIFKILLIVGVIILLMLIGLMFFHI